jgi:hypothetical protein
MYLFGRFVRSWSINWPLRINTHMICRYFMTELVGHRAFPNHGKSSPRLFHVTTSMRRTSTHHELGKPVKRDHDDVMAFGAQRRETRRWFTRGLAATRVPAARVVVSHLLPARSTRPHRAKGPTGRLHSRYKAEKPRMRTLLMATLERDGDEAESASLRAPLAHPVE